MNLVGYRDYRGVRVVGAWTWLAAYGFGVATEIEYDEAYAVLHYVRRSLWLAFSLLLAVAVVAYVSALSVVRLRQQVGEARQLGQYTLEELIGKAEWARSTRQDMPSCVGPLPLRCWTDKRSMLVRLRDLNARVQLASSLTHPNTVEVYDYGRTDDGLFYFAMEYLPGVTLGQLVRQEGPICAARVLYILRQVLGSLAELMIWG